VTSASDAATTNMAGDFAYESLNLERPSFRLLQLCKGSGPDLSGFIHLAWMDDLESVISYEALSYTWGSLDIVNHIDIQGQRLGITSNLYHALHRLRLPDEDRMLWVDAICINQEDLQARGHQVRQTGQLHKEAWRVLAWLGEGT
jgi:hypothetical protein